MFAFLRFNIHADVIHFLQGRKKGVADCFFSLYFSTSTHHNMIIALHVSSSIFAGYMPPLSRQ